MNRVKRWTWCAVLAPILLLVVGFAAMAVLNEVANPSSALDVTANWALLMVLGAFFYLPALVATALAVAAIAALPLVGRVIATIGLLWTSVVWAVAVTDTARMTFDPQPYDEYGWAATLTATELLVFAVPYVAMLLVNSVTIWALWRPPVRSRCPVAADGG
ncbi:hypothetical protein [Gordonia sp. NPDC058843]|uniref:hypothetical protein n=1 Tax=Gordonia sp. NPDC058843 TaxID=3346648 RepID=UPI00368D3983